MFSYSVSSHVDWKKAPKLIFLTGAGLTAKTVARLASHPNIVAIKEASGSLDQVSEILLLAPNLTVLSGDDSLTLGFMSVGAKGMSHVPRLTDIPNPPYYIHQPHSTTVCVDGAAKRFEKGLLLCIVSQRSNS